MFGIIQNIVDLKLKKKTTHISNTYIQPNASIPFVKNEGCGKTVEMNCDQVRLNVCFSGRNDVK